MKTTLRSIVSPVKFHILRPRTGDKVKTVAEVIELTNRAAHEQELFSQADWQFIQWLAQTHPDPEGLWETLQLKGQPLLQWLVRWGDQSRMESGSDGRLLKFEGQLARTQTPS